MLPSIVEIDVTNLWRLHAQKGCFIFLPVANYECLYDFDKIIFPYRKPFSKIKKHDIYPNRKSPLEIELDKFFELRNMKKCKEYFKKRFKDIPIINIPIPSEEDYNKIFKKYSSIEVHSSWKSIDAAWKNERKFEWKTSKARKSITLDIHNLIKNSSALEETVSKIENLRNQIVEFKVKNNGVRNLELETKLKILWDGMIALPFENLQIAKTIRELLKLELKVEDIQDKVLIEFDENIEGGWLYSRAYITLYDFSNALRDDIAMHINRNHPMMKKFDNTNLILAHYILTLPCDIRLIINFYKFIELFALKIIPSQVSEKRGTILFNPSKIKSIGFA